MKKSLLILSVLFIIGACSNTPNTGTDIEKTLSEGLQDAVSQLGSVAGFTKYSKDNRDTRSSSRTGDTDICISEFYEKSNNEYKIASVTTSSAGVLVSKAAEEGSLVKTAAKESDIFVKNTTSTVTTLNGYTKIYHMVPTDSHFFESEAAGGQGWITQKNPETFYYLVKSTAEGLLLLPLKEITPSTAPGKYESSYPISDEYAQLYIK